MQNYRKVVQTHHDRITDEIRKISDDVLCEHQRTIAGDIVYLGEFLVETHGGREDPDLLTLP